MCGRDQLLGIRAVEAWQFDAQISGDAEPTLGTRTDANGGGHLGAGRDPELELLPSDLQGTDETGRVARGKKLLGVRTAAAGAAKFLGRRELDREVAALAAGLAIAAAGGGCGRAVSTCEARVILPEADTLGAVSLSLLEQDDLGTGLGCSPVLGPNRHHTALAAR